MDWVITIVPEAIYGFGTFLIGFSGEKAKIMQNTIEH